MKFADMKKLLIILLSGMLLFTSMSCNSGGSGSSSSSMTSDSEQSQESQDTTNGFMGNGNVTLFTPAESTKEYSDEINLGETAVLDLVTFLIQEKDYQVEVYYSRSMDESFSMIDSYKSSEEMVQYQPQKIGIYRFVVKNENGDILCDGTVKVIDNGTASKIGDKGSGNVTLFGLTENPAGHYDVLKFGESVVLDVEKFITQGREHRVEISYRETLFGFYAAIKRFNTSDKIVQFLPKKSGFYHFRVYYLNEAFLCDGTIEVENNNTAPVASLLISPETDDVDLNALESENKEENSFPIDIANSEKILLDVSNSHDTDGPNLTFDITVTAPDGSSIQQANTDFGKYEFTPAARGLYKIELKVADGINDPGRDNSKSSISQQIYVYDQSKINEFYRTMVIFKKEPGGEYSVYLPIHDYYLYDTLQPAQNNNKYFYYDVAFYGEDFKVIAYSFFEDPIRDLQYFEENAVHNNWDPQEKYNEYLDSLNEKFIGDKDETKPKGRLLDFWKRKNTITKSEIDAIKRIDMMVIYEDVGSNFHVEYSIYNEKIKTKSPHLNIGLKIEE